MAVQLRENDVVYPLPRPTVVMPAGVILVLLFIVKSDIINVMSCHDLFPDKPYDKSTHANGDLDQETGHAMSGTHERESD